MTMDLAPEPTTDATADLSDPRHLLDALLELNREVRAAGARRYARWRPLLARRAARVSASNLAAYLALRERDLRPIQTALSAWGLSSLGRGEARVLPSLDAVIATLGADDRATLPPRPTPRAMARGERMLSRETAAVLGPEPPDRRVRIMVTMPSEAAEGPDFALALAQRGMDCARINCAHDGPDAWRAMIAHIRRAERLTGRPCRVLMDLGGPKARTGAVLTPDGKRRLKRDDALLLARSLPAADEATPFQAVCQLPEALDQIAVGAAVWLDDGKLGTRVERLTPDGALLRVVQTPPKGYRLKAGKGLNFPDTDLRVDPLNDKDRRDLDVVAAEADMVGYSFVQSAADVANLHRELDEHQRRTGRTVAIIAKIETHRALRNLPEIIVRGAGTRPFGVMIARGDLAVEIGYQRLAEIQEEVLWLCEAAHVPVVWATQVLENFVTTGTPSRAEVTDAAMSARAECVMLNKGPYIAEGVTILDDVLTRMQAHQRKKSAQLRALHLWREPAD